MNKTRLTIRYALHQLAYWAAAAGVMSFATTFLLQRGFPATQVGTIMAIGTILSCLTQPVLAERADRSPRILFPLIVGLTVFSGVCFACVLLPRLPRALFALLYLLGVWVFDAMMPLMNSVCVRFMALGCPINYGVARAAGALSFAVAALGIGYLMERTGANSMVLLSLMLLGLCAVITLGYPRGDETAAQVQTTVRSCSVTEFFRRYRWYCASLLGILLLGMFHAMTENYLIAIFERLGGGSSNVGVALFIPTVVEAVVMVYFSHIRRKISDNWLLRWAGVTFLVKSFVFLFAPNIGVIYAAQVLQATSYGFLSPTQMYYADAKVHRSDMVKGQAFITAAYSLGCAMGNFMGGVLVQHCGVVTMLTAGVGMAAAGTVVLFVTVGKKDAYTVENA